MDATSLMIGVITGAIGIGYFMYGKRQQKIAVMLSGVLLGVYPYFTNNVILLVVIGLALIAAPFFLDF